MFQTHGPVGKGGTAAMIVVIQVMRFSAIEVDENLIKMGK